MRHKKRRTSLLEQIFNSNWKFSATLAAIILTFSFVFLPVLGLSNIFIKALVPLGQFLSILAIAFLSIVSLVKILIEIISKYNEERSIHPAVTPQIESGDSKENSTENTNQIPIFTALESKKALGSDVPAAVPNLNQSIAQVGLVKIEQKTVAAEDLKIEDVRDKWTFDFINSLEWKRFEDITSAYFHEIGIRNKQTGLGADGGIDLLLYEADADQPSAVVQCKKWSNAVGIKLLREFLGVMFHQGVTKGYFFTTDKFNQEAINFAKEHNIELVDGKALVVKLQRLSPESQYRIYTDITLGDYTTPTCVRCGSKMVLRKSEEKNFWGCRNYPKCRAVINIKTPTKSKPLRKFGSRLKKVR